MVSLWENKHCGEAPFPKLSHWQPYALGTRTLSWFGHGRIGNPMLLEHERYHGLGMDALASVCSSCLLCRDPDKMPRCSRAADIPKCAFYQGSLVAHLPKTKRLCSRPGKTMRGPSWVLLFLPGCCLLCQDSCLSVLRVNLQDALHLSCM